MPEAISNLPIILKGDNDVIFDRESLSVCRKETYETESISLKRLKKDYQLIQNGIVIVQNLRV